MLWRPLCEFFKEDGPLILRNFFSSQTSETILNFLNHVLPIFSKSIDELQKDKMILPDLLDTMNQFNSKIKDRMDKKFFGIVTSQLLRRLPEDEGQILRDSFMAFYKTTLNFVAKWFRAERFPSRMSWISLADRHLIHEDVMELSSTFAPELCDSLFDEVSQVNELLKKIEETEFVRLTSEQKWQKVFGTNVPSLYKLVSKFLSIPISNAFVERVFSLCSAQWTDVRNSLKVETVKSLAQIKVNYDFSCSEFYKLLISNKKMLKAIIDNEKYLNC